MTLPQDAQGLAKIVHELFSRNQPKNLSDILGEITAEEVNSNFALLVAVGNYHYNHSNLDDAISSLGKAVQLRPQEAHGWFCLGSFIKEKGRLNEALISYQNAINLANGDQATISSSLYHMGDILYHQKRFEESLNVLRMVKLVPQVPETGLKMRIGQNLISLHEPAAAIGYLEACVQDTAEGRESRTWLAEAYSELGNFDKAIEHYKVLSETEPDEEKRHERTRDLAFAYINNQMHDEAITVISNQLPTSKWPNKSYNTLASCYLHRGIPLQSTEDLQKAREASQKSIEIDGKDLFALGQLAISEYSLGNLEEFDAILNQMAEINPDSSRIKTALCHKFQIEQRFYDLSLTAIDGLSLKDLDLNQYHVLMKYFKLGISSMEDPNIAAKDLLNMFRANNNDPRIGIFLTTLLDYLKDEETTQSISKDIVWKLLADKNFSGTLVPYEVKSKNPVKLAIVNQLSSNLYIIKTVDPEKDVKVEQERLRRESEITSYLRTMTDKVPEIILNNGGFLFERRIKAANLSRLRGTGITQEQIEEQYKLSLETLAVIQSISLNDLSEHGIYVPEHNALGNLRRRLISRFLQNQKLEAFYDMYMSLFNEQLARIPNTEVFNSLIHTNAHPGNTLVGGYWVDWESPAIGNALIDVAELLNSPEFPDIKPEELAQEQIHRILTLKQQTGTKLPRGIEQSAQQLYRLTKLHNHIELIGSMLIQGRQEHAQYHYANAQELLGQYGAREVQQALKDALVREN